MPTRSRDTTIPNSKPSEGTTSDSGSDPGKERVSVTASGKEGKFLRMRLAKALAASSVKGRNFKTKGDEEEVTQVRDKTSKQLVKEPTQKIGFQDKGEENLTKRANGDEGTSSLGQRQSEATVNPVCVTETRSLTSSSSVETKNSNYYSTKSIQHLADEVATVSKDKKTHPSNLDWKTLLQAKPRDKRNISRIPKLVSKGGDKAHELVSDKSLPTSQKPQETLSAKPDPKRQTSDQRQLPKPPATSLGGVSPQKGKEISEDVEKRLEHARHMLQKRSSGNSKEQLWNGQEKLLPNEAIAKDQCSKTKSKVAIKCDKFDALENELIQFKENIFKNMEEFEEISNTAKQLQNEIESVRTERLQVFRVPSLKGKIHETKLSSRNGTQNTADSVYTAML